MIIKNASKRVLFTLTGYLMYYIVGWPIRFALEQFCPIPATPDGSFCFRFWAVLFLMAILGLPLAVIEFHRAGKWMWMKLIPSWRVA